MELLMQRGRLLFPDGRRTHRGARHPRATLHRHGHWPNGSQSGDNVRCSVTMLGWNVPNLHVSWALDGIAAMIDRRLSFNTWMPRQQLSISPHRACRYHHHTFHIMSDASWVRLTPPDAARFMATAPMMNPWGRAKLGCGSIMSGGLRVWFS